MITLSTFDQQRNFLVSRGITDALPVGTLEYLRSYIDWNRTASLLTSIATLSTDLELLSDEYTLHRKDALETAVEEAIDVVREALLTLKEKEAEELLKKAGALKRLKAVKARIIDIAEEVKVIANETRDDAIAGIYHELNKLGA